MIYESTALVEKEQLIFHFTDGKSYPRFGFPFPQENGEILPLGIDVGFDFLNGLSKCFI